MLGRLAVEMTPGLGSPAQLRSALYVAVQEMAFHAFLTVRPLTSAESRKMGSLAEAPGTQPGNHRTLSRYGHFTGSESLAEDRPNGDPTGRMADERVGNVP